MSGIEVVSKKITAQDKHLRINTSGFQNGMYFMVIDGKGKKIIERQFVVENMK